MRTRRSFLRQATMAASICIARLDLDSATRVFAAAAADDRPPEAIAQDEAYWREIQQAFLVDRTIINLDNGSIGPSPATVHHAHTRYLRLSNQAPVYYMWEILEPQVEAVRRQLAREFGCDPEELAVTRGATESLQIPQLGLDLTKGDEVLTTTHDYPLMIDTWEQRVQRDGIKLTQIPVSIPVQNPSDLIGRFQQAITARTKVLHLSHVTYLTGQRFPIAEICRMARARGIRTIVDGAQAVGQIPVTLRDLECDYYGASLHKWVLAPVSTGFLYVRKPNIASLWPLQPATVKQRGDIRKFEEVGTHPAAAHNAVAEALAFQQAIGIERKAARLRYLRDRWARRLAVRPRVRLLTDLERPGGLATIAVESLDPTTLAAQLWDRGRIVVAAFEHLEVRGIRVTPGLHTTLQEIDTFVATLEELLDSRA